ncbi:MAG: hypothetical protein Greene071436_210 [Parcubacteria group bacterium Greene0714_36]|nr:MAG: hypothetical protein Greene071436_210 [Parcubacteria group bacterium Greene0714_36]
MGILFGLIAALSNSLQNTFIGTAQRISPFAVNFLRFAVAIPVLAVLVGVFSRWQAPPAPFWVLLLGVSLPIEITLSYFYVKAFQYSAQSLAGPFFSLSALFLIPLGYVVLGEALSLVGFLGVLSVLVGPFFLGVGGSGIHPFKIHRKLFRERGLWYMIIAALLASMTTTAAKFSYHYAPPLLFAFYLVAALAVSMGLYLFMWQRISLRQMLEPSLLSSGVAYSFGTAFHFIGLSFLPAAYFVSVKRVSAIFDVFLGRIIQGEEHFRQRMIGAILMVAGLVLIVFG